MERLSLAQHTLFADLLQRCLDASFIAEFPENGAFTQLKRNGRAYWYYKGYAASADAAPEEKRRQKYVGPADDPEITRRVEEFQRIRDSFAERREMVRGLVAMGLPRPAPIVGDVVEALWKAGLFRVRGVLVGTVAYQTYAGLLGVRLPAAQIMTGDIDVAQFYATSKLIGDSLPPILDVLGGVDATFREVPSQADARASSAFINGRGLRVEFLTPNTGKAEHQRRPATMPSLGGAGAQPLRFLDFLIHEPVHSLLLHKGGVPVLVPSPERYAIHKLIVAEERRGDGESAIKARKDLAQAELLFEALTLAGNAADLGRAWIEAWGRGAGWRKRLSASRARLGGEATEGLEDAVREAGDVTGVGGTEQGSRRRGRSRA